jgi:hypothetical protein
MNESQSTLKFVDIKLNSKELGNISFNMMKPTKRQRNFYTNQENSLDSTQNLGKTLSKPFISSQSKIDKMILN